MKTFVIIALAAVFPLPGQLLPPYPQVLSTQYPAAAPSWAAQLNPPTREVTTPDGAQWRILPRGLERRSDSSDPWEARRLFHSRRFLPCDEVLSLAPDGGHGVYVKTSCGFAHLRFQEMTLAQKAKFFDQRIAARHWRHGLVADSLLRSPGDLSSNQMFSNDNDGLWTAMYAASQLFEYKATGSQTALNRANQTITAILHLEKITGMPGYPARSWISAREEKPKDGIWYPFGSEGAQFKSDTSSDEIVGHFFIFDLAWELLPPGPLRDDVRATAVRMMDRILNDGYLLLDRSGKPTRWGKWSLEYFASPGGRPDSPLNALELLSFLKVTHRITGQAKYDREFRKAAFDLGYLDIMTQYLALTEELNYSDEELALLSFYPWMRKESDPKLRAKLVAAFEQWWSNIQREKNPLWNTIREVCVKRDPALTKDSVRTLRRLPMDTIFWRIENSWRTELPRVEKPDRHGRPETTVLLAPDERSTMKWNGNPFVLDGGNGGRSEDDGAFFLLPYWMGRYYRLWNEAPPR